MPERFAFLRSLTPPKEAHVLWVELDEEALHFVDGIFGMYDGVANVRREYREVGGRKLFKIFVAPGCLSEALEVLERAKKFVRIGEIQVEP
ncbi:MAG: DUF4911 domain-containing protein [Candidatus Bipolaricaulota bacterium]|nr:DUF4911 domain-containing protein [Candidatus Bipolaricaulota bacterium]MCX7844191.1 DUF4911 domain-containing protein [Candidatus Bipolaricaulota bacterium]MDW8152007.1 hypothetical protein [Candidatus Bipolaricaulota bacterium]